MPAPDIAKTATTVFSWVTTGVGWVVALLQWRKKRKAEAEFKLIHRRGDAPYVTPSDTTVDRLLTDATAGEAHTAGPATVLTVFHGEVPKEMPAASLCGRGGGAGMGMAGMSGGGGTGANFVP